MWLGRERELISTDAGCQHNPSERCFTTVEITSIILIFFTFNVLIVTTRIKARTNILRECVKYEQRNLALEESV